MAHRTSGRGNFVQTPPPMASPHDWRARHRHGPGGISTGLLVGLIAGGAAFLIVVGTVIAVILSVAGRAAEQPLVTQEKPSALSLQPVQPQGPYKASVEEFQAVVRLFGDGSLRYGADGPKVSQAMSDMMFEIDATAQNHFSALERLRSGFKDGSVLSNQHSLEQQLVVLASAKSTAIGLEERFRAMPDVFSSKLTSAGASTYTINGAVSDMRRVSLLLAQLADNDQTACDVLTKLFDLLRSSWGSWSFNEEAGSFVFTNEGHRSRFNAYTISLNQTTERQRILRRQLSDLK